MKTTFLSILILLASFGFGQNNSANTIDSLEKALANSHNINQKIRVQTALAKAYQPVNIQKASEFANNAMNLSLNTDTEDFMAEIYGCLGDVAVMQDSLEVARKHYEKSLKLFESVSDIKSLAGVTMVLGNIASVQDNLAEAMIYYQQAVQYANESELENWLGNLYYNIAILNIKAGSIKEAQSNLSSALGNAEQFGDSLLMASIFDNFGITYIEFNDTVLAGEYLKKAINIYLRADLPYNISLTYQSLSKLEKVKKDYTKAIYYLDLALEYGLKEDISYPGPKNIILSDTYAELGQNHLSLNDFDKSMEYFRQSLNLSLKSGELKIIATSAKGIADIWYKKNNSDSAYYYYKLFKCYSDSLINEENIRKMANQEAQFKYEKLLAAESQKREEEINKQRKNVLILVLVIIGLALAISVLILFLKLGRKKVQQVEMEQENLKKELEIRNKELTTHVIYQLKGNELILNISNKLKSLLLKMLPENKKIIEEIIREISLDSGKDTWKEFEVRFQQVHTSFYKNLGTEFPELTSNDLRLAAFLKLNMNTKEIAAITYQSTNSIDVGRSRLRQKLGLNKDENLSAFLSRF